MVSRSSLLKTTRSRFWVNIILTREAICSVLDLLLASTLASLSLISSVKDSCASFAASWYFSNSSWPLEKSLSPRAMNACMNMSNISAKRFSAVFSKRVLAADICWRTCSLTFWAIVSAFLSTSDSRLSKALLRSSNSLVLSANWASNSFLIRSSASATRRATSSSIKSWRVMRSTCRSCSACAARSLASDNWPTALAYFSAKDVLFPVFCCCSNISFTLLFTIFSSHVDWLHAQVVLQVIRQLTNSSHKPTLLY